ncbi:MAG TPA: 50S ribosomal protein L37e [archaeon]|nr:50S ribosomal protein L37e [archaeon]
MSRGTAAKGKRNKSTHFPCRRCGKKAYHIRDKTCAACGYGHAAKQRRYAWAWKTLHGDRVK